MTNEDKLSEEWLDKKYLKDMGVRKPCKEAKERARKIAELEKEKCELLGTIQGKDEVIANLKEQNKDLCESLDIMNNRESELLDQIEKMKRCSNCKYSGVCNRYCDDFNEWKLAE